MQDQPGGRDDGGVIDRFRDIRDQQDLQRRHLNAGQRAMALAQYANFPVGRPKSENVRGGEHLLEVAALAGVNKATIQAIDTLEEIYSAVNGSPASIVYLRGLFGKA